MSAVHLDPELKRAIDARVERGDYPSAQALVESAVWQLLQSEPDKEDEEDLEDIRRRIAIAEAEIDSGNFIELTADDLPAFAKQIHERGLKILRRS